MALFSQCFAISSFIAPFLAGIAIDRQGHGMILWATMSASCLLLIPLARGIKNENSSNLMFKPRNQ